MEEKTCIRVEISGIVQGVGFRWRARKVALELGISGWIKNRPDGVVEAVFQGSRIQVQEMTSWAHKGPPGAAVRKVIVHTCDFDEALQDFTIF